MINGYNGERFSTVLREGFTPSAEIRTADKLVGRDSELTQIKRAFNSIGRIVFIYGDRGVGKSSLALSAAAQFAKPTSRPIQVRCGSSTTFADIIQEILSQCDTETRRFEKVTSVQQFSAQVMGTGAGVQLDKSKFEPKYGDLNFAINAMRHVAEVRKENTVIIIDEFERLVSKDQKQLLAEFFKSFPDNIQSLKLIVCGIAKSIEEMMGSHLSTGRRFENVPLASLHHDDLWKIITKVGEKLGVTVEREALIRIGQISDGFPYYTHLIGETLFYEMHDDTAIVLKCEKQHFEKAIKNALKRSDEEYRSRYSKAIFKSKLSKEYEVALWCLADHNDRKRQVTDIHSQSYVHLETDLKKLGYPALDKGSLNQRLLKLRQEGHAEIIVGHGSGWYTFRENVMRGYVRMVAEDHGIKLLKDHFVS